MFTFFLFEEKCLVDQFFEDFEGTHIRLSLGEAVLRIFDMYRDFSETKVLTS